MREVQEIPQMNERKTMNSPMNTKKVWTAPVLEVILLNSAENTTHHNVTDTFPHKKS